MTPHSESTPRRLRLALRFTIALVTATTALAAPVAAVAPNRPDAPQTSVTADRPGSLVRRIDTGRVRGVRSGETEMFLGIPYAAPPVGALRWASPHRARPWHGVRDAGKPGHRCAQAVGLIDKASSSENCLYANVTVPRDAGAGSKLPVMVWIHGNGFINGAGSLYGAQRLAAEGKVVVVSFNYRLGIFGFLAHPALDGGKARHLSGNFGLEDQQAALRWVRRNVAAFGGDRRNVTIFGESAGGTSVCAQLAAPSSAGLFQHAIMQSAECSGGKWQPGPPTWFPVSRAQREAHGRQVAADLGCRTSGRPSVAACLRSTSVKKLLSYSDEGVGSGPTYGGATGFLPIRPGRAFATGRFNRVPVLIGTTRDEHRLFTVAIETVLGEQTTGASYREQVRTLFTGRDARRVLTRYPIRTYTSPGEALSTMVTDWAWACPTLSRAKVLGKRVPTFAYEFADEDAPWFTDLPRPNFPTGAFHGSELQYLFEDDQLPGPSTPEQVALASRMVGYWSQFARSGSPGSQVAWPSFADTGVVQQLRPGTDGAVDVAAEHQCGFWRSVDGRTGG